MKIQKISSNASSFAEISFMNNSFNETGITQLTDNELDTNINAIGFLYSNKKQ